MKHPSVCKSHLTSPQQCHLASFVSPVTPPHSPKPGCDPAQVTEHGHAIPFMLSERFGLPFQLAYVASYMLVTMGRSAKLSTHPGHGRAKRLGRSGEGPWPERPGSKKRRNLEQLLGFSQLHQGIPRQQHYHNIGKGLVTTTTQPQQAQQPQSISTIMSECAIPSIHSKQPTINHIHNNTAIISECGNDNNHDNEEVKLYGWVA